MPRSRSTVAKLDPRIREAVDAAIREGRATIDELVALIAAHGGIASRSAVGRYRKDFEDSLARYREAQEVAGRWVSQFQADPDGDVGRLLAEMLKTLAFTSMADKTSADPKDIHYLARAVKDLVGVDQVKAQIEARLRAETKQRADAAVEAVEALGREKGLSADTVDTIKARIFGVAA
jgi:hypothetical protein